MDEIKAGYKKTDVGVIPEDWDVVPLHEVCEKNGLIRGPFGGELKKECFVKHGYKVYTQQNAIYADENLGSYYISDEKFQELKRFSVSWGDFIVSCSGTIGKIHKVSRKAIKGVINQALLLIHINNTIIADYFLIYFRSNYFQNLIIDSTQGGAMQNLVGMSVFKETPIILPNLIEQRAIASVLSDMDALLRSLEQLIQKKRDIKTATMQQLLTGKVRLPGFSISSKAYKQTEIGLFPGDWDVNRTSSIGMFSKGKGICKNESNSGDIPCIRYGELYNYHEDIVRTYNSYISRQVAQNSKKIKYGDILFAGSGETKFEIGKCAAFVSHSEAYAGGDIVILSPFQGVPEFWGYLFNSQKIVNQKSSLGQGDAIVHINASALASVMIPIPPHEEQQAIATVLSDMDSEIEALEQRLEKTRDLKQGMMQELLTGSTRLLSKEELAKGVV